MNIKDDLFFLRKTGTIASFPGARLGAEEKVESLRVRLDGGALPRGLVLDEQLLQVEQRLPLAALLTDLRAQ